MIKYVQFFPTLRCNKSCNFCFTKGLTNSDFPAEKIEAFIDILKQNHLALDILGGEPFMYEHLKDLVELAINSGIKITISTNGTLPEKIEEFLKLFSNSKLYIGVSLNGSINPELLSLVKKYKLWIKSVVTKKWMIDERLEKFIRENEITYYLIYMDAITVEDLKISMPFYNFIKLINEWTKECPNIKPVFCKGFIGADMSYRCPAGTQKITVMPDATVYPCYLLAGRKEYCLGNIFENSLTEILSSKRLRMFRNFRGNVCDNKICHLKEQCHGGCVAHSIIHYGVVEKADPRCNIC